MTGAIGRTDLDARPCAVIATVRQRSWQELADRVRVGVQEIHIGPYDDAEFRVALKPQDLPADYLQAILENAREVVRCPRYFDLVIKHKDKLDRYDAITPEVLYWLDLCDKIRSRRAPASGWDEQHFQGVLMGLTARCNLFRSLKPGSGWWPAAAHSARQRFVGCNARANRADAASHPLSRSVRLPV